MNGMRPPTLRAAAPLRPVDGVVLLPIERVSVASGDAGMPAWFVASLEPAAVVVRDAAGLRAYDRDGRAVALETIRRELPALDALLATL